MHVTKARKRPQSIRKVFQCTEGWSLLFWFLPSSSLRKGWKPWIDKLHYDNLYATF